MAFGKKGGDAPRVVGFDFGPPAAPAPAPPPAWVAESAPEPVAPPVAADYPPPEYPPPAFPPPAFAPPAYQQPAYQQPAYEAPALAAAPSLDGFLAPVSTMPAPAPVAAPPAAGESEHRFWRAGAEMPTAWSEPQVALPRRRSLPVQGIVSLVVTVVALLGGYRWYQRHFGDPFTKPKSIAGYELISNPTTDSLAREVQVEMAGEIGRPLAGVYGTGEVPLFVAIAGDSDDKDNRKMYDDLVRESKGESRVGPMTTVGEVACATVSDATDSMVVCLWSSKKGADGVVFHFGSLGVAEVGAFTNEAKRAIV